MTAVSKVKTDFDLLYYELAPSQIAEWFAYQLDPNSPLYNISFNHFFFKKIDVDVFVQTWNILLERHECFNIRFALNNGRPVQYKVQHEQLAKEDLLVDCIDLPFAEAIEKQNILSRQYALAPFDLLNGQAYRLKLVAYPEEEYQLIFVIHHIIWDELSTVNLIREFVSCYNAIVSGQDHCLPSVKMDFLDYVEQEVCNIESGKYDAHKNYWLKQFNTMPSSLDLPYDFVRPAIQSYSGKTVSNWISRNLIQKVKNYLFENKCTLFSFFMSVVGLYMYRVTGEYDFALGCPLAGRPFEHNHTLGCFAVPIALRCNVKESTTFFGLLSDIKIQMYGALEHYQYPLYKIIETHDHVKDLSRTKLFSVMAGVQNEKPDLNMVRLTQGEFYSKDVYSSETHDARFDLAIGLDPVGSDIKLFCSYNTDLFCDGTVTTMLDSIESLIEQVVEAPHQLLNEYMLVSDNHYEKMLREFCYGKSFAVEEKGVVGLFLEQVVRSPAATAVICNSERYSYTELYQRVATIRAWLLQRGVVAGDFVAVMMNPSLDLIAALLAILSCAASYVPLSDTYPENKITSILSSVTVSLLLTQKKISCDKGFSSKAVVCYVEDIYIEVEQLEFSTSYIKTNNAYVIFTSGTTGEPKGIPIQNESLTNLIQLIQDKYQLNSHDCMLFSSSVTFDASVLEIFLPLIAGASILIYPDSFMKHPDEMLTMMEAFDVSIFQTTPLLLSALAERKQQRNEIILDSLRLIICGSDVLSKQVADFAIQEFGCELNNHYGPTEVTVDALTYNCRDEYQGDFVPLGKPLSNTTVFIVDTNDQVLPVGVIGEIVVASPGLASGYWNDPGRTDSAFLMKNLDHSDLGIRRFYRTGDRGKFDSQGNIYFHGRMDSQVKVNGYRIDLQEIESILAQHTSIAKAAVKYCHAAECGESYLEAFVELKKCCVNTVIAKGVPYYQFTLSQMPQLELAMNAAHHQSWPKYFSGSPALKKYWPSLYDLFPDYQYCMLDESGNVACVANGIPINWDFHDGDFLPTWDQALALAFEQYATGVKPNAVLGLSGIVLSEFQGKGLSNCLAKGFRALAASHGLQYFWGPVRPVGKLEFPQLTIEQWANEKTQAGEPKDFWLRVHARLGAKILGVNARAQEVKGTIQNWEEWLQVPLDGLESYTHPTLLQPVILDHVKNIGIYHDPTIWVCHQCDVHDASADQLVSLDAVRKFLLESLPAYMCPQYIEIVKRMPMTQSDKVDRTQLRRHCVNASDSYVAPTTEIQKKLVMLFGRILGIERVSVMGDFFMLGGQSLKAIELLFAIRQQFDTDLSLKDFYKNSNPLQLSKLIC